MDMAQWKHTATAEVPAGSIVLHEDNVYLACHDDFLDDNALGFLVLSGPLCGHVDRIDAPGCRVFQGEVAFEPSMDEAAADGVEPGEYIACLLVTPEGMRLVAHADGYNVLVTCQGQVVRVHGVSSDWPVIGAWTLVLIGPGDQRTRFLEVKAVPEAFGSELSDPAGRASPI